MHIGNSNLVMELSQLDETVEIYKKKAAVTDVASKDYKPKRVAAYCRVSKNVELQKTSLETQIAAYERIIAERLDWQLVDIYYDRGITGTCAAKRPGFLRMIEDAKAGKIDMILAKSISRFARNTVDMLEYTRMLRGIGVSVYFEKERIDTSDLTSEMLLTVYAAFAQEESHSISENVKRGYRQRFQMGIVKYSKVYGYYPDKQDKNIWYIQEDEAAIVREIFYRYLRGDNIQDIRQDLTERGVPSPGDRTWYDSTISKILRNERYIGDARMQKTVVTDLLNHVSKPNDGIVPTYYKRDHHPAIISREDFDTVQRMFLLMNAKEGSRQYPYYDFLKCPCCGKQMVQYMASMTGNPRAWICSDHVNCNNNFLLGKFIDKAVKKAIMELPPCLTGYEEPIRCAQEHFKKGGDVELYFLKKLVSKIEIVNDYSAIKITFLFDKEVVQKIRFERPSERPNAIVQYKKNGLFINGVCYAPGFGKKITTAIDRIKRYNESLVIIPPENEEGIYRAKNEANKGQMSWGKIKE